MYASARKARHVRMPQVEAGNFRQIPVFAADGGRFCSFNPKAWIGKAGTLVLSVPAHGIQRMRTAQLAIKTSGRVVSGPGFWTLEKG
jgi:hypothetical protein